MKIEWNRFFLGWMALVLVGCSQSDSSEQGGASSSRKLVAEDVPSPNLEEIEEPPVADVLKALRESVLGDLQNDRAWGEYGENLMAHDWKNEASLCFESASSLNPKSFRWPYLKAICSLESHPDQALAAFERAVEIRSDYAPALARLARSLAQSDQVDKAVDMARKTLDLDPQLVDGSIILAQSLLQLPTSGEKEAQEASEVLKRALIGAMTHSEVHATLARALAVLGQTDKALEHSELARRFSSRSGVRMKDPEGRPRAKPVGSRALTELGHAMFARQDYERATEAYRQALMVRPEFEPAHRGLADTLSKMGDKKAAIEQLEQALELSPKSSAIHLRLGALFDETGEFQHSEKHYIKASELRTGDAKILYQLSQVQIKAGKEEEAAIRLRESLKIDPGYGAAHFELAKLCETLGPPSEVETHYLKAIQSAPGVIDGPLSLGMFYAKKRRTDEAVIQFDNVLAIEANHFQAMVTSAVALAQAGRPAEAIPRFERAFALRPQDKKLAGSLAGACRAAAVRYIKSNEPAQAREAFERAVAIRPDWVEASRSYAWFLATQPDSRYRDGARAVALAETAQDAGRINDFLTMEALAAAYAEVGRFDEAINVGENALAICQDERVNTRIEKVRKRVELFRASTPYRTKGNTTLADG